MSDSLPLPAPFYAELEAEFGNRYRANEPLANHTTARIGGPADVWLSVQSVDELVGAVAVAREHAVPVFTLGSGANLLIADGGIRGLVVENRADEVHFPAADAEPVVRVSSGTNLPGLARRCAQRGLSGLEWAVGVPGTVGGAITNNAGAFGSDMAQSLFRAELLAPNGERLWQPADWFEHDYRTSRLKRESHRWIVLQAELRLKRAQAVIILAQLNAFNQRRKSSQPPGATMGSMFKNPPGDYAGRLIEAAGLKGRQVGHAQVSPVHANFFQNLGGATAADMLELILLTQMTVKETFGVTLELEIEVVGELE